MCHLFSCTSFNDAVRDNECQLYSSFTDIFLLFSLIRFGEDTFIIREMIGEVTAYVNTDFELRQVTQLLSDTAVYYLLHPDPLYTRPTPVFS